MNHPYEDILHLPYPRETSRPRMSRQDRAAQFSPFAALMGYEASLAETARKTCPKIELTEEAKEEINRSINYLLTLQEPFVTITYYEGDFWKEGGAYYEVSGHLCRVEPQYKTLHLKEGTGIWISDILSLTSPELPEEIL